MKKTLLSVATLLLIAFGASAQNWGWGPKVGVAFSTANNIQGAKVREGMVAGIFFQNPVCNWFTLEADVLFSQQGYDLHTDPKTRYRVDYLAVPVLGKYYLLGGLNFQLGAEFDYLLNAKKKYDGTDYVVHRDFNKFNIQFLTGLAYDFDFGLIVEGRYLYGLTEFVSTAGNARTGALQVSLGWCF